MEPKSVTAIIHGAFTRLVARFSCGHWSRLAALVRSFPLLSACVRSPHPKYASTTQTRLDKKKHTDMYSLILPKIGCLRPRDLWCQDPLRPANVRRPAAMSAADSPTSSVIIFRNNPTPWLLSVLRAGWDHVTA